MEIRPEESRDAAAIGDVTVQAFASTDYGHQGEAGIVEALRAAGALTVSLVADEDGQIVGHVAFSPVRIAGVSDWYGLAPLSIHPGRQRQGLGQALVREGLARLAALGAAGCVVFGDPAYYRRFGFESDPALRYGEAPSPYLQRLVLRGPAPRGKVAYHPSFGG